ncbi:MAG: glutathione S-transferase family protein [Rhodobacteraceae bacterium]|nr:glutathione S-transferase family protein [Paracoccaceae bacterium]MBR9821008.1 glutathione S-transferase family protein [Paracoccaceae bacterium]
MKLFHAPGSCSLGIRMILEEAGLPYEVHRLDVRAGDQRRPEYLAVNPKGKVPALLRDDGRLLTEFPAIAFWLARQAPGAGLLPSGADGEARALELLDFIVASLHMRGTALLMRPAAFATSPEAQDEVRARGRETLGAGLARLSDELGHGPFLMGERFSLPDAAAFYLLGWLPGLGIEADAPLADYHARLAARPSAQVATAD